MEASFKSYNKISKRYNPEISQHVYGISIVGYEITIDPSSSTLFKGILFYEYDQERKLDTAVRFLSFGKDEKSAKNVFMISTKISHPGLLKVWCVTYCDILDSWLVCYDDFQSTLKDFVQEEGHQPFDVNSNSHLMTPWWSKAIRGLLSTVNYFHHAKFLLHEGLSNIDNYVVVNEEIKLINLRSSEAVVGTYFRQRARKKDMLDLKQVLGTLLVINSDNFHQDNVKKALKSKIDQERNLFLKFIDNYENAEFPFKRICNHPFLLNSEKRLSIFVEVYEEMGWNARDSVYRNLCNLTSYLGWKTKTMSRALRNVYNCPSSNYARYKHDVPELIHFMRNVVTHGRSSTPPRYDRDVMELCPELCIRVYEMFSFLGLHEVIDNA